MPTCQMCKKEYTIGVNLERVKICRECERELERELYILGIMLPEEEEEE